VVNPELPPTCFVAASPLQGIGKIPKAGGFDHLAGLPVFDAPEPLAGFKHGRLRFGLKPQTVASSALRLAV